MSTVAAAAVVAALLASSPGRAGAVGPGPFGRPGVVRAAIAGSPVLAFGDAADEGSLAGTNLNHSITGIAGTPSGYGYWLVASDGGVFSFGDAGFYGSTGGLVLNRPVVGIAPTPSGHGYWLVASDGGVFSFGDASFSGSTGGLRLNQPIVAMSPTPSGRGYWLAAADGGIFTFGDAPFEGSAAGAPLAQPVVGIVGTPSGHGYWLAEGLKNGSSPFTPSVVAELASRSGTVSAAIEDLNTGQLYQYRGGQIAITASIVKVQILGTLLQHVQAANRSLNAGEQALAVRMIEQSDNDAASALYAEVGGAPAMATFDHSIGMTATLPAPAWGLTTTTAADQVTLVDHLAQPNAILSNASRTLALSLMEQVTASQDWGVSAGVAPGATVALKNGWLPVAGGWTVNSIGWVRGDTRNYVIAVLSSGDPSEQYGIDSIAAVSSAAWSALAG